MRQLKLFSRRLLREDFVRFCIVGSIGFFVNAVLLKLFLNYGHLRIYIAQALAAEIALFSNFMLHHTWTYKSKNSKKTMKQLLIQFHVTSWVAIIGSALTVGVLVNFFSVSLLLALLAASAGSLLWNFFWTKYIIWQRHESNSGSGEREVEDK